MRFSFYEIIQNETLIRRSQPEDQVFRLDFFNGAFIEAPMEHFKVESFLGFAFAASVQVVKAGGGSEDSELGS